MAAEPTASEATVTVSHGEKADEEARENSPARPEGKESASNALGLSEDREGLQDNSNVPEMSYLKLFWFFFYNFGLFAWGGPVAQIALIKDRLVVKDKWITL